MRSSNCPDCGVAVGKTHQGGCDIEKCRLCGGQFISCSCPGDDDAPTGQAQWEAYVAQVEALGGRLTWTGEFPGHVEAEEFGFYCFWDPPNGWTRCEKDHPKATVDLNRLYGSGEAVWNKEKGRWVLAAPPSERSGTSTGTS